MKKNLKKLLLAVCCAALLVCVSIGATVAYLTSAKKVVNTFTVGSVGITLDEAKVTEDGTPVPNVDRVTENKYKLMPSHKYTKDPTVHVTAGSEDSWIFVKVESDISAFEAAHSDTYNTITEQITANDWTKLEGVDNVYYKAYEGSAATDLEVFSEFKIADTVEDWTGISANTKITVTAYAIQKDGFDTAAEAWPHVRDVAPTT